LNNHDKALEMYAAIKKRKAKENKAKFMDAEIYMKKRLGKLSYIKSGR